MDRPNRVAFVTGTAQGIGRGCSEALLDAGWTVAGVDMQDDPGDYGDAYHHWRGDVRDAAGLAAIVEEAAARLGRIDALVNNAGVHPVSRVIDEVTVEDLERLLQINLVSVFVTCKAALPYLRREGGSIVNIASLVALVGQEQAVEYCATKGAITGITKALAIDEAPHDVRVNAVCPGTIRTPLAESLMTDEQLDVIDGWSWAERMGTPREVGDVVAFLCSAGARYVTGQDIVVSGGAELGYGLKGRRYYDAMQSEGQSPRRGQIEGLQ